MIGPEQRVRHIEPVFSDHRGTIADILENETVSHVTAITSVAGAVRGNHYHEETSQYVYVTHGRLRYRWRTASGERGEVVLSKGDLILSPPQEHHSMRALEDTDFIAMTLGPRGGREFESDTVRLQGDQLLDRDTE